MITEACDAIFYARSPERAFEIALPRSATSPRLYLAAFARSIRWGKIDVPRMRRYMGAFRHVA
jgi:hypothetical protein